MSDVTVFEQSLQNLADWHGAGDAPAYPIYEGDRHVVLVDRYPKFLGQVVLFPTEGYPGQDLELYELPDDIVTPLDHLTRVIQRRMRAAYPQSGLRMIRHEEGYAVPDHPHTVLFPAERTKGKSLYEPSLLTPDQSYFKEVQRTLMLDQAQKIIVDERLKMLADMVVDWT